MGIQLGDGTHVSEIELLIMATGWKTSLPFTFNPTELSMKLGLPYKHKIRDETPSSEAQAEVDGIVKHWKPLETKTQQRLGLKSQTSNVLKDSRNDLSSMNPIFPLRLFRNMVSSELTTSLERDRSLLVLGMAKGWQTMIVSEVQALWGAVYLLGGFDGNEKEEKGCLNFTLLLVETGSKNRLQCSKNFQSTPVEEYCWWTH